MWLDDDDRFGAVKDYSPKDGEPPHPVIPGNGDPWDYQRKGDVPTNPLPLSTPKPWETMGGMATPLTMVTLVVLGGLPGWSLGGGNLPAVQAITAVAGEFTGPLAYAASLIAITGSSIGWFRHHHDMGALAQGGIGVTFVAGIALGAAALLGMIPGVGGAVLLP